MKITGRKGLDRSERKDVICKARRQLAAVELPATKNSSSFTLLGLFAAIDLAYIVGGFCGTDKFRLRCGISKVMLLPDSIQPLKTMYQPYNPIQKEEKVREKGDMKAEQYLKEKKLSL